MLQQLGGKQDIGNRDGVLEKIGVAGFLLRFGLPEPLWLCRAQEGCVLSAAAA